MFLGNCCPPVLEIHPTVLCPCHGYAGGTFSPGLCRKRNVLCLGGWAFPRKRGLGDPHVLEVQGSRAPWSRALCSHRGLPLLPRFSGENICLSTLFLGCLLFYASVVFGFIASFLV